MLNNPGLWYVDLFGRALSGYDEAAGGFPTEFAAQRTRGDALVVLRADNAKEYIIESHNAPSATIRLVAAHDVGKPVYPKGVVGQVEGAAVMGVGFALLEEFVPGKTTGFKQYRIPRFRDAPEVVTLLVGGAVAEVKGVAESANAAAGPAITNAIAHATGERVTDLPARPRGRGGHTP